MISSPTPAPVRVTNGKEESFACQREAPILSRRRLLFQQFGGAVHYSVTGLLLHWPPAHQTSGLSQGPRLATALPIPASTSPSPDQASCLWAPPAPDHPMCVWVTCHHVLSARGRVGQGGTWGPVRDQRGRENGEAGSRGRQQALRPGERRHRVLDVVGRRLWPQRRHLVVVEGAPF